MTTQLLAILDLDLMDVIAHLVNFLVLIVALGFLVYKPMLKLIRTRRENVQNQIEENERAKKEAIELKEKYEEMLSVSEREIRANKEKAKMEAEEEKENILAGAKSEAAKIVEKATEEAREEKEKSISNMKGDIVSIATMIASGILGKKISEETDAKLIDDCLEEWSK